MADIELVKSIDPDNPTVHDVRLTQNALTLVTGRLAIAQQLTIRLLFHRGEWFLDARLGIPYEDKILIKKPNEMIVRGIFQQAITETPRVLNILSLDLAVDPATRLGVLSLEVVTETGEVLTIDFSEFLIREGEA